MNNEFDRDRRAFLAAISATAGVLAIATTTPFSAAHAESLESPLPPMAPFDTTNHDSVWDIDSMCGHFPAYAHPIPPMQPQAAFVHLADNDPLGHFFMT